MSQNPSVPEGYGWVWTAFLRLNSSRQSGVNGPLPIAFHEIVSYTDSIYGRYFSDEDLEDFFPLIRSMDQCWLEEFFRRNKPPKPRGSPNGRR